MGFYSNHSCVIKSVLLINVLLFSVETCACVKNKFDRVTLPCGCCGAFRRQWNSSLIGTSGEHYLTTADGLFNKDSRSGCKLRNYCKINPKVCQNDSNRFIGICYPLYGTYQCQCRPTFFGQNCEYKVDISNAVSLKSNVFQQNEFRMPVHRYLGLKNKCVPQAKLINCGSSMQHMPKISRFRDTVILSSLRIRNLSSICKTFQKVIMKWQVWVIGNNHNELKDIPVKEFFNKNSYLIEEGSLHYGFYKVKLSTTAVFHDRLIPESTYCYFEVVRIPIQTVILGGSLRQLYFKQNIGFDILTLVVPDRYEPSKTLKVIYQWQCDDVKEYFCKSYQTSDTSRLIPGPFKPLQIFHFTLKVKTVDTQTGGTNEITEQHSENQTIRIANVTTPDLAIKCFVNCGGTVFKSNPQEIIHLEVTINRPITGTEPEFKQSEWYQWKYSLYGSDESKEVDEIREKGTAQNVLIVMKNMLIENQKYSFTVEGVSLKSGFAQLGIQTSAFPKNVTCTIIPDSGVRGETFFDINCTYQENDEDFTSVTYEFHDRYSDEHIDRYLGFSVTGILERIRLTRNKLYVHTTNFFGASFETVINVILSPSAQNFTVAELHFGHQDSYNYIYRMGLISAYSDLIASQPLMFNATNILLEKLEEEYVDEVTGAMLLQNVLYNVACKTPSNRGGERLESISIVNVAKIMHRASTMLKKTMTDPYKNVRYVTTTTVMDIAKSALNCSSIVLGSKDNYELLEADTHKHLKASTFSTMETLDNIITLLAFKLLPSIKRILLHSTNIVILILDTTHNVTLNKKITPFVQISKRLAKWLRRTPGCYIQTITFVKNPFWWCNGGNINTDVINVKLSFGAQHTTMPKTDRKFDFDLNIKDFEPILVSGFVKQLDPKSSPQINDFLVAVHRIAPETNSVSFISFSGMKNDTILRVVILHDQRPDYDYMMFRSNTITKDSSELKFSMKELKNDSFFYIGILPGLGVKTGDIMNYSFKLYSASCKVWMYGAWMTGNSCNVSQYSNKHHLLCSCTILNLTIGGYMYIPPNDFNPFSDIPLFMTFMDNPFIIVFLLVILSLFVVLLIWSKIKDADDKNKINIIVLEDNHPRDSYGYLVAVFTGSRIRAGTTSNVGIRLFGEEGVSRAHVLFSSKRPTLKSKSDDWFLLFTPHHLGSLTHVKLWIDYSGQRPSWYCSKVFVCDLIRYETDTFFIEKWFGITMQEIRLKVFTECATSGETNKIRRLIFENLVYGFREIHLWASVFLRHPRSPVTRTQRLSVAVCGLFVTMFVSILLYSASTPQREDFALYSITKETFVIGIISSLVGSLVNFVIMHYFKCSYKFTTSASDIHAHNDSEDMYHFKRGIPKAVDDPAWLKSLRRYIIKYIKPCKLLPVQNNEEILIGVKVNKLKICYSWLLCLIVMIISGHVIIVTSLRFEKLKTSLWLTSLLISMFQIIFITLPVKIILIASLLGITKTRYYEMMSHNIGMKKILQKLILKSGDEFEEFLIRKRSLQMYHPAKIVETVEIKKQQQAIVRVWAMAYVTGCLIYFGTVVWLIHGFHFGESFFQSATICYEIESYEICKTRSRTKLHSMEQFLENIQKKILPVLFSKKWYNNENLSLPHESFHSTGWLQDGMTRLVGPPRLRQIRVRDISSCHIPKVMINISSACLIRLSPGTEDRGKYNTGWTHDDWTDTLFDKSPWVFTEPSKALGTNVRAPSGYICHGGGYIISLCRTLGAAKSVIRNLIDTHWIDKQTRIVIMEFTTYNPNTNIFTSTIFVTEALPIGSVTSGYRILSIKLSKLTISGVVFLLYVGFFSIRVLLLINVMGISTYFRNFWNIFEVLILIFGVVATVYYVNYLTNIVEYREKIQKQGNEMFYPIEILLAKFISMKDVISILFCLVAFRMLRIIRINNEVRQYIHDLCAARLEIIFSWQVIVIFMFIQWRLIMFLLVEPPVYTLKGVLKFQSDFKSVIYQYKDATGKLLAFFLSFTSQIGMFSFILSLNHYYKKGQITRMSQPIFTNKRTQLSRLWESAFD